MDFVTLAEQTSHLRVARFLDQLLGDNSSSSSSSSGDNTKNHIGPLLQSGQDQVQLHNQHYNDNIGEKSPILSKTAEAELYLLATNFLLYVAMVLITILVAKIYFPETLERNNHHHNHNTTTTTNTDNPHVSSPSPSSARSFSYRMAAASNNMNHYFSSDYADEEDDDEGDDIIYENENEEEKEEEEEEILDSEDEVDHEGAPMVRTTAAKPRHNPQRNRRHNSNHRNVLEFQQSSLTKLQVLRRLIFCSLMLNVTFVIWGLLQERMLTRRYPREIGEYFTYSYALVFTNRFWTLIMSGLLMLKLQPRLSHTTVIYEYTFPSISNMLSSWCQYEALRYVSFPAVTLFKSFKLAPVMMMGKILGNRSYPQYDYMVALAIGLGIAMFMTSTDDLSFGYDSIGEPVSAAWTGVMLLCLYLLFDSFTSQFQSRMFQRHGDLSMIELMLVTSAFSTVLSFVTLLHTHEFTPALQFMMDHSEIHVHFFLFSICSTIGQLFIFYTIRNFGAVVFTLIMTCRILISIALSCILYGHEVSATGFFGLMLVLGAVMYRIRLKAQGQQLLTWKGIQDDNNAKAMDLVQEWHVHVDM